MCSIYLPEDVRTVPAGASFCVAVMGPEACESVPGEHTECLVHVAAPDGSVTSFRAAWEGDSMAFVADVFMGGVGSHAISASVDVRPRVSERAPGLLRASVYTLGPRTRAASLAAPRPTSCTDTACVRRSRRTSPLSACIR